MPQKLPPELQRTRRAVYLTDDEYELIKKAAQADGQLSSQWMRNVVLREVAE